MHYLLYNVGMKESFDKYILRYLLTLAVIAIATGSLVYHFVEHLSWLNAYYLSVISLTTVGYGDYTPHTNFGKIFTTFYVMIGIGIVTTFISYRMRRRGKKYAERHQRSADSED